VEATIDQPGDLWGQLESLLDTVWECERQWRLDDRFDLLLGLARRRARG
jgi:hypothetical protein